MLFPPWSNRRVLALAVLAIIVVCYVFVNIALRWVASNGIKSPRISEQIKEQDEKENASNFTFPVSSTYQDKLIISDSKAEFWESEYKSRVERVRQVCEKDEIAMMRRVWRVATNRRWGKQTECMPRMCPIILDEKKVLFFCFIPKVASTKIKQFFLNISNLAIDETKGNLSFHDAANKLLKRVSPMFYPPASARRFFKIIFVRHPFERLVSVFRDKAENPVKGDNYFYEKYFIPIMKALRPNQTVDESSRLTFPEFVWYLTHTLERSYDDHWAPYWSRCDPCLVDYDFIGKIETASHDFPYAFNKVEVPSPPEWWTSPKQTTDIPLTKKYFKQISDKQLTDLYRIYKLDFDLFGYSVDEFLREPSSTNAGEVKVQRHFNWNAKKHGAGL